MDMTQTATGLAEAGKIAHYIAYLELIVDYLMSPMGFAIVVSIGVTQVVKAFDHTLWRDLRAREVWAVSWVITAMVYVLLAGKPWRENIQIGLVGGFISPALVAAVKWAADKTGMKWLDPDEWFGGNKPVEPPTAV